VTDAGQPGGRGERSFHGARRVRHAVSPGCRARAPTARCDLRAKVDAIAVAFDVLLSTSMNTIAIHDLVNVVGGGTVMVTGSLEKDRQNNVATVGATFRGRDLCERFARDDQFDKCMSEASKPYDYYPTHPVTVPDPK
jgi:hypothetical protein